MNTPTYSRSFALALLLFAFGNASLLAQASDDVMVSVVSEDRKIQDEATLTAMQRIEAARLAENQAFAERKQAIRQQGTGPKIDIELQKEVQRHLAENKKISMQAEAARKEVISDLKQKWEKVDNSWKQECTRHDNTIKELEKLPDTPERAAKIEAESNAHRNNSRKIAVERNVVHEGVMRQANLETASGKNPVSSKIETTAGTKITHPDHRGMTGDLDAGGGYRTTEKAAKILNEIGVKNPKGGPVRVQNGVLETSAKFGMTVNTAPGTDRIGSSGHQAQVKMGAAHGETYISETGGAVTSKPLKQHLATLDNTKKAVPGLNKDPINLTGGAPEGQAMVKGALKSAKQADISPESVEAMAKQRGVKNPEKVLDRLADIKAGRSTITSADEAAKLQGVSRDIINAADSSTKTKANAEIQKTQQKIVELEKQGKLAEAKQLREEIADYRAKAKAATEAVRSPEKAPPLSEPANKPSSAVEPTKRPSSTSEPAPKAKTPNTAEPAPKSKLPAGAEPEAKPTTGGKLMRGAGFALGAYGIYEGFNTAVEEMLAKKQGEPKTFTEKASNKLELAARTLWHGLGFGAAAEVGTQAGKESYEQYKKDIADKKISADSMRSYAWMKTRAVLGGLAGGVKAITYDAAKNAGTQLGTAIKEGREMRKDRIDAANNSQNAELTKAEQAQRIKDMLIGKGASSHGAQRAADLALKGDFSEAKRLNKILEAKQAQKRASSPNNQTTRTWGQKKKDALRKENTKKEIAVQEKSSEDDLKLRDIVMAKLREKGLPTGAELLDRLLATLKKEGMAGLDAAIAEFTQMQGDFTGTVAMLGNAHATLRIRISGSKVTGTLSQDTTTKDSMTITTQKMNIPMKGNVDIISGSIEMTGQGPCTTVCKLTPSALAGLPEDARKNIVPTTNTATSKWLLRGSYNGKGYKGSTTEPWSVTR